MYVESIANIDEGDIIAFIDNLQFEYEGVHEITDEQALTIDWVVVHKAQVTGSIIILEAMHLDDKLPMTYRMADFMKVIVDD